MRSIIESVLLAARVGTAWRRGSLERVWATLTPFERAKLAHEADDLSACGIQAAFSQSGEPVFYTGPYGSIGPRVLAVCGPSAASGCAASGTAVELAEQAARWAVGTGATVVASDIGGSDSAAVRAALDAGGLAISVLAEGFGDGTAGSADPHGQSSGVAARHITLSPCAPGQPWSVDTAMACNATIAYLCTAMVAVDAANTGATLDAGMRALGAGRPVLAVGATPGSRLLVDYGSTAAIDEIELMWWLSTQLPATHEQPAPVVADFACLV